MRGQFVKYFRVKCRRIRCRKTLAITGSFSGARNDKGGLTKATAAQEARAAGWFYRQRAWYCPTCGPFVLRANGTTY